MELYLSVILAQAASVMSCDILDHVADEIWGNKARDFFR